MYFETWWSQLATSPARRSASTARTEGSGEERRRHPSSEVPGPNALVLGSARRFSSGIDTARSVAPELRPYPRRCTRRRCSPVIRRDQQPIRVPRAVLVCRYRRTACARSPRSGDRCGPPSLEAVRSGGPRGGHRNRCLAPGCRQTWRHLGVSALGDAENPRQSWRARRPPEPGRRASGAARWSLRSAHRHGGEAGPSW